MDAGTSLSSTESTTAATRTVFRCRPLHTCGVSILMIAHRAYTIAHELNGPVGSMTKKIATIAAPACPIISAMRCQWLAILSFVDDQILAVENMVETLFPPSSHLFNKIDEIVHTAETLPGKVDDAVNKFPMIIHQFRFLDWALVHVISWLKFLISTLTHWGVNNTREKEIMIDINKESELPYNAECPVESPTDAQSGNLEMSSSLSDSFQDETGEANFPVEISTHDQSENVEKESPISDSSPDETKRLGIIVKPDIMKCSYKEILEKGTKENLEKKNDSDSSSMEEIPKATLSEEEAGEGKEEDASESIEETAKEDPILDLFEASWHMKPGKRGKGSSMPRSFSFM
ncbi:hypothetical protein F0562_033182 [Nyssa sinensis]|uniref:Uncharacterized protein n=1 Tax=Nyssa sinensis TaxID=561372 RepID=A0A5J5AQ79_9ASTE|nr:hypothetical protein F0562_033182 [Nyssa sinensis]